MAFNSQSEFASGVFFEALGGAGTATISGATPSGFGGTTATTINVKSVTVTAEIGRAHV